MNFDESYLTPSESGCGLPLASPSAQGFVIRAIYANHVKADSIDGSVTGVRIAKCPDCLSYLVEIIDSVTFTYVYASGTTIGGGGAALFSTGAADPQLRAVSGSDASSENQRPTRRYVVKASGAPTQPSEIITAFQPSSLIDLWYDSSDVEYDATDTGRTRLVWMETDGARQWAKQ